MAAARSERKKHSGQTTFSIFCEVEELFALNPYLGSALLRHGEVLSEFEEQPQRIWFPETCVISLIIAAGAPNGASVGLIGREGAVCEPAARQVVQVPGRARFLLLSAKPGAVKVAPNLEPLILRHANALHGQVMQVAACNALHSAEARLARSSISRRSRGCWSSITIHPGMSCA